MTPATEAAKAHARGWILDASMDHMRDALLVAEQQRRDRWRAIGIDFPDNNRIALRMDRVADAPQDFISKDALARWKQLHQNSDIGRLFDNVEYEEVGKVLQGVSHYAALGRERHFEPFKSGRDLVFSIALEDMTFASDYATYGSCLRLFGQKATRHSAGGRWYATTTSMGVATIEETNKITENGIAGDGVAYPKLPRKIARRWFVLGQGAKGAPSVYFWREYNSFTVSILPLISMLMGRNIDVTNTMTINTKPAWFANVFMRRDLATCKIYLDSVEDSSKYKGTLDFPKAAHYDTVFQHTGKEVPANGPSCVGCRTGAIAEGKWFYGDGKKDSTELVFPTSPAPLHSHRALCPKCFVGWRGGQCHLCSNPIITTDGLYWTGKERGMLKNQQACAPCVAKHHLTVHQCRSCGSNTLQGADKKANSCTMCASYHASEGDHDGLKAAATSAANSILQRLRRG